MSNHSFANGALGAKTSWNFLLGKRIKTVLWEGVSPDRYCSAKLAFSSWESSSLISTSPGRMDDSTRCALAWYQSSTVRINSSMNNRSIRLNWSAWESGAGKPRDSLEDGSSEQTRITWGVRLGWNKVSKGKFLIKEKHESHCVKNSDYFYENLTDFLQYLEYKNRWAGS